MTSIAPSLTRAPGAPARAEPGRIAEFFLVGGSTVLLFPLLWLLRAVVGLDSAELAVGFLAFHAAHVINDPHFAVTYLLFYKNVRERAWGRAGSRTERMRYWIAGFVVPVLLAGWLIVAMFNRSGPLMGALIQFMFMLVGWHYVKQGFGVITVLSARRGVRFDGFERRALLGHCLAGWAYAWANPATPAAESEEKGVVYLSMAHPAWFERVSGVLFACSALLLAVVLYRKWRRERRLPPLAALGGLLISIWVWSVYSSADPLLVYLIPGLHSIQYLYFVWRLRHNQARTAELPPFFGPPAWTRLTLLGAGSVALGWLLFHGAPDLLDAIGATARRRTHHPLDDLGPTAYFAGFFAFVNIHHYFMDSVIWRRENPDMRYLSQ